MGQDYLRSQLQGRKIGIGKDYLFMKGWEKWEKKGRKRTDLYYNGVHGDMDELPYLPGRFVWALARS